MSTLNISKKDNTANLVYQYLLLNGNNKEGESKLSINLTNDEVSKLVLEDSKEITASDSILAHLASSLDEKISGSLEEPQVQADIQQWLSASSASDVDWTSFSKDLHNHLSGKSYLVNNRLTLADLAVYSRLRSFISQSSLDTQKSILNTMRWFNNVQGLINKNDCLSKADLEAITLDLEALSLGPKKKKEKKPAATPSKEAAAKPIAPSMIDLRVGHIIEVAKHEAADSLYVEQIELGEEAPRTVVSGLVNHFSLEEMKDRYVVLVCNLKPANMRGVKSFAMVLCGTNAEGKVEFVEPPKGSKPGDRIYFEGFEGQEPEAVLNPKKKIWETIQPGLHTDANRVAGWTDPETQKFHRLRTHLDICQTATAANAPLK